MIIYYEDKKPVNLLNVETIDFLPSGQKDEHVKILFSFGDNSVEWKFSDKVVGDKVYETIKKDFLSKVII